MVASKDCREWLPGMATTPALPALCQPGCEALVMARALAPARAGGPGGLKPEGGCCVDSLPGCVSLGVCGPLEVPDSDSDRAFAPARALEVCSGCGGPKPERELALDSDSDRALAPARALEV